MSLMRCVGCPLSNFIQGVSCGSPFCPPDCPHCPRTSLDGVGTFWSAIGSVFTTIGKGVGSFVRSSAGTELVKAGVGIGGMFLAKEIGLYGAQRSDPNAGASYLNPATAALSTGQVSGGIAAPPAPEKEKLPEWLLPVGIGAGVLVSVLLLRDRR